MGTITFEVECEVEGKVYGPEPDTGAGRWTEDADISSVSMLVYQRTTPFAPLKYKNVDLLEGLDAASRQRVIQNIFASFSDQIDEAILADA